MIDNPFLDIRSLILFSSAVLNLGVFFYLIFNKTRLNNTAKFYLALATISVSLWMFASWIAHFSSSIQIITFCTRFSYGMILWLVIDLILFTLNYLSINRSNLLITAISVLTFATILLTDNIVLTAGNSIIFGKFYSIYFFVNLILFLILIISFIKVLSVSNGIKRGKLILLTVLIVFTLSLMIMFNIFLPLKNELSLVLIGQSGTFIFACAISLIVLQEKIFSFKFLIAGALATFFNGLLLSLIFLSISQLTFMIISSGSDTLSVIKLLILIILIFSLLGQYLGMIMFKSKNYIYKICGVSTQNLEETIKWLINKTNQEINLSKYLLQLLQKLKVQLFTAGVYLYLSSEKKIYGTDDLSKISDIPSCLKVRYINQDSDEDKRYALIYPILSHHEVLGYLFFKHKSNNGFFSLEEIHKINDLQKILSIAINLYNY